MNRSTERTKTGIQYLAPWASQLMDTRGPIKARGAVDVPMPLFTQDEDAKTRADAARQTTIEDAAQ